MPKGRRIAVIVANACFVAGLAYLAKDVYTTLSENPLPVGPVVVGLLAALVCGVFLLFIRDRYRKRTASPERRRHEVWGHLVLALVFGGLAGAWIRVIARFGELLPVLWRSAPVRLVTTIAAWPVLMVVSAIVQAVLFARKCRTRRMTTP